MTAYVLDTSALLAYIEDEAGADTVETLLISALDETDKLYVSTISMVELLYISQREQGVQAARQRLEFLHELPLIELPVDRISVPLIADIKARKPMSLADCCIAALASLHQATLVHKDPEYEQVASEISQLKLPYKPKLS
jgi:predicted nucleic acid-binding protein